MVPKTEPFDEHPKRYDRWFEENERAYRSELAAVRSLLPEHRRAVEVGVGTGRFAAPLGIGIGVEPSGPMAALARGRGIEVVAGVAEKLPLATARFDLVLMVTTVCFLDDLGGAFREAHRVLSAGGHFVIGFLDRESPLGRAYDARKERSDFYRSARFGSAKEIVAGLERAGFDRLTSAQTIFDSGGEARGLQPARPGHGDGLFVVVRCRKKAA